MRRTAGSTVGSSIVSVFIVSDIRLFREGLTLLLSRTPALNIVGSATAHEIRDGASDMMADIALLDATLEDLADCVRCIRRMADGIKLVALALGNVDEKLIACAEAGISAFVGRDGSYQDLLRAIDHVSRGETTVSPSQAMVLLDRLAELAGQRSTGAPLRELTRRERQIVPLIERGLSNKEIARHLSIESATIKNHVHNILEKMQLRRRGEIAAYARRPEAGQWPGDLRGLRPPERLDA